MQHLRVLKVMNYEHSPFVSSLIEFELDQATTFAGQKQIQGTLKVLRHSEF